VLTDPTNKLKLSYSNQTFLLNFLNMYHKPSNRRKRKCEKEPSRFNKKKKKNTENETFFLKYFWVLWRRNFRYYTLSLKLMKEFCDAATIL
jgi:hypothetical protein